MSSWFTSGLGWSETRASPFPSEKTSTIATPCSAAQTTGVSESLMSSTPMHATEVARSKPLEVTRTMTESTTKLTSELLSRAAMETRAFENAGAEDDALRLLRWEAEAQQVDKDQSEVMHQQWRLFREQVATLSSKSISMRGEIKDLYRIVNQEEAERRAAVEVVQAALRVSEERIFGMLEDLCRNQVSGMALEMERAQRIGACKKVTDELEAEKSARLDACGELASEFSRLQNILEESLQKNANFMKEQSSIIETRVREMDLAVRQSVKHLEVQVEARHAGERSLEEKLVELRTLQAEFVSKSELFAVRKELERETTERIRVDRELGTTEGAIKTELQALRNELMQELAERVKGDTNCLSTLTQGLERESAERAKANERCLDALKQGLDKARTEREDITMLTEALAKTLSQDYKLLLEKRTSQTEALMRNLLEDEAKARAAGDVELVSKTQSGLERMAADMEREAAARIEGDKEVRKELERKTAERIKVDRELGNAEGAMKTEIQALRNELKQELAERVKANERCVDALKQGLDKARTEREDLKLSTQALVKTLSQDYTLLLEKRISQAEALARNLLEDEAKARAAGDTELGRKMQSELERMAADMEREAAARIEGDKEARKELERETTERIKVDTELGTAEGTMKTELQALRNELLQELAERVKGNENCFDNMKQGLEQESAERVKAGERCLDALKQGLDKARAEREDIKLLIEALAKTLSKDYTLLLEKSMGQAEALMRNLLEDEAKARAAGDVALSRKAQAELERIAADLEHEAAARIGGDKDTVKCQFVESALKEITSVTTDLQNQLEQEMKVRVAGDEKMGKLLTEGLEKAGSERSEILSMVGSIDAKIAEEAKVRVAGDEQLGKLLTDGVDEASRGQAEIIRMVDSMEVKMTRTCRSMLEDEVQVRIQSDEKMMKDLQDGLEKACSERLEVARMVESVYEKLKVSMSELESTVKGSESNLSATIVDLSGRLDSLTSTVQADAVLRVEMESKLEQSCKVLRTDIDQAFNEAMESLKVDISALNGGKDELDAVTREIRVEVEEHKQHADKEWLLIYGNIENHKAQYEEYKQVREAAHSSLQVDMEQMWKSEVKQLKLDQDSVLRTLEDNYDALRRQHEEFAAVVWKEEVRRVWEAIDGHTHDVAVTDFEEKEEATKNVIKREIVREAPRMQISRVGIATVPAPTRGMVASNSMKAFTSVNNTVAVRAPPRMGSPAQSPGPARGSPARVRVRSPMTMTPPSPALSQKVLGVIRSPAVERLDVIQPESPLSVVRSASSSQSALPQTQSSAAAVTALGGVRRPAFARDTSPKELTAQQGHAASMGRAIHEKRSNSNSTATERTEEIIGQPGKIHHHLEGLVGKAVFEHKSDLDPETKRDPYTPSHG